MMIEFILIIFMTVILFSLFSYIDTTAEEFFPQNLLKEYSPDVKIGIYPKYPIVNKDVQVIANVTDKYGKVKNPILKYFLANTSTTVEMKLYSGNFTIGTFVGVIPANVQKENAIIKYQL